MQKSGARCKDRGMWRSPWGRVLWGSPTGAGSQHGKGSHRQHCCVCVSECLLFSFLPDVYFKHRTLRAYKED